MKIDREKIIKNLESELEELNRSFLKMKKTLQKHLQTDERKLNFLTDCATGSFQYLERLAKKGEQLKILANTCKKFETEREKVSKWLPISNQITKYDGDDDDDFKESVKIVSEQLKDIGNVRNEFRSIRDCGKINYYNSHM